ncbi:Protein kinase-like domain protein [Niveomyces insectorum RCEF 264]|uniref:EKC/KEOPS complex subunit BUD32 n=1 Tax=Niveomyces insectorum RCEF 264 TaxID=1081102 RepID=A0A162MKR2_9HYPO|nr:Protein kinase-like domain protein [Niveomyces insectorum RCEF 264]
MDLNVKHDGAVETVAAPTRFVAPELRRKGWWRSIVGCGASSFVTTTDGITALKGHQVWEDGKLRADYEDDCEDSLAREARVYALLGPHPHVLRCFGLEDVHPEGKGVHALRIEFAPGGDVRGFIRGSGAVPPLSCRLRLARDVTEAVAYIHRCGVRHCDLTCRNLFLCGDISDPRAWCIKLGDFGGAVVESDIQNGEYLNYIYEEQAYELPLRGRGDYASRPPRKRELFALGSALFELVAWCKPYEGLKEDEIEAKYADEQFPALDKGDVTAVAPIVRDCWAEQYDNAGDIVKALDGLLAAQLNDNWKRVKLDKHDSFVKKRGRSA